MKRRASEPSAKLFIMLHKKLCQKPVVSVQPAGFLVYHRILEAPGGGEGKGCALCLGQGQQVCREEGNPAPVGYHPGDGAHGVAVQDPAGGNLVVVQYFLLQAVEKGVGLVQDKGLPFKLLQIDAMIGKQRHSRMPGRKEQSVPVPSLPTMWMEIWKS